MFTLSTHLRITLSAFVLALSTPLLAQQMVFLPPKVTVISMVRQNPIWGINPLEGINSMTQTGVPLPSFDSLYTALLQAGIAELIAEQDLKVIQVHPESLSEEDARAYASFAQGVLVGAGRYKNIGPQIGISFDKKKQKAALSAQYAPTANAIGERYAADKIILLQINAQHYRKKKDSEDLVPEYVRGHLGYSLAIVDANSGLVDEIKTSEWGPSPLEGRGQPYPVKTDTMVRSIVRRFQYMIK